MDTPAQPTKGFKAFYKFIGKEVKYPKEARHGGIEGKVYVQFIVEKTGEITNIKVIEGIGSACDKEGSRVMKLASKWTIPKHEGKVVRQKIVIPIQFELG